jgi:hypothetical protein
LAAWIPSGVEARLGTGHVRFPHDRFTGFAVNGAKGVAPGLHAFVIVQRAVSRPASCRPNGRFAPETGRQHLLDHANTQGISEVQPNSVADHLSREAVAGVARMTDVLHPFPMPRSSHPSVNLTVPLVTMLLGAKLLKVTPKAVDLMLVQLGGSLPRESTGRRRYRAWDIV